MRVYDCRLDWCIFVVAEAVVFPWRKAFWISVLSGRVWHHSVLLSSPGTTLSLFLNVSLLLPLSSTIYSTFLFIVSGPAYVFQPSSKRKSYAQILTCSPPANWLSLTRIVFVAKYLASFDYLVSLSCSSSLISSTTLFVGFRIVFSPRDYKSRHVIRLHINIRSHTRL